MLREKSNNPNLKGGEQIKKNQSCEMLFFMTPMSHVFFPTLQVGVVRFLKKIPSFLLLLLPPLLPPATPDQNSNATPDDNVKNFT